MVTKQAGEPAVVVEEELKRAGERRLSAGARNASLTLMTLGIIEIVFGALALLTPVFAGAFFVLLLGGAVLVSGVVNIVAAVVQGYPGRFAQGAVAAAAGLLAVAHPLFGLSFLTALVGIYLLGTGITRFLEPQRNALAVVNGIVGVVFGIIVLAALQTVSAFLIGLLVGINVIVNGIHTASTGAALGGAR
ncbi:MAG: HdeD family acid-resistance protein [Endomicrobiales bacterium]